MHESNMHESFEHKLIKGRIAETIFEMMFRGTDKFSVHRFGYEYTAPLVAQYQNDAKLKETLDTIRHTPDFILVEESDAKKGIYIVEVKYRASFKQEDTVEIANDLVEHWPISWIFLISRTGFYFDNLHNIIRNAGEIRALRESWVSKEIQNRYKELANDWLWSHAEQN